MLSPVCVDLYLKECNQVHNSYLLNMPFFLASFLCQFCAWVDTCAETDQNCFISQLTDKGINHIGSNCKNLKNIDISECRTLTDEGILKLTQVKFMILSYLFGFFLYFQYLYCTVKFLIVLDEFLKDSIFY